jgi:anti-anti-sigma regulatory factor
MARLVQFAEPGTMLRISADEAVGEPILLRLDGQITGRWVKLLRGTCEVWLKNGSRVVVDLKNVLFADREGIDLLRDLADRGVEILNALPFIFEQIRRTTP